MWWSPSEEHERARRLVEPGEHFGALDVDVGPQADVDPFVARGGLVQGVGRRQVVPPQVPPGPVLEVGAGVLL